MMAYAAPLFHAPAFPRVRALSLVVRMTDAEPWNRLLRDVADRRDRAAFQRLFEHFAPRIKGYLMRLGAGADMAEDLAQEALLTMWRKGALFDPAKASASTWLFTIARNLRTDALRRERRAHTDLQDVAPEAEPGAEEGLQVQASEAALRAALANLPPDQNEIVMLSYFSDKPHSQIAAELGIPLGTVKSRLRLAMARLRGALEEKP